MRHAPISLLAAAGALAALAAPAAAGSPPQATGVAGTHAVVELADTPVVIEDEGLKLYAPVGAVWQRVKGAGSPHVQITAADQTWVVNVQTPRSSDTNLTATGVTDKILEQVIRAAPKGSNPLERDHDLLIAGLRAERFYVSEPSGKGQPGLVRGYTVLSLAPGRFATFELICAEAAFARARPEYELMVGTLTTFDAAETAQAKTAAIDHGQRFIASLSAADYDAAIAATGERWDRLFSPAETGADADASELSYRRFRATTGPRSAADTRANARADGYLVKIDSRYLNQAQIIDSRGSFWMSPDRQSESWTLTLTLTPRAGGKPQTWTETGRREGDELDVSIRDAGGGQVRYNPAIEPEKTLTHVERFLLPQLLIQNALNGGQTGDFGYGVWSSRDTRTVFRTDTLARDDAGRWILTSTLNEHEEPQISLFQADGTLIKTTLPTGAHEPAQIWAPVDKSRLVSLWSSKNLPMD